MVKKVMGLVAVVAMALTIGGQLIAKTDNPEFIWEYQDAMGGTTIEAPTCIGEGPTCALLFHFDENAPDNIGAPALDGNGQQIRVEGVRLAQ